MREKRFSIKTGDDVPNVVKFKKGDKVQPVAPRKPVNDKEGCELDRIRVEMDPKRFDPKVVRALLAPWNCMDKHLTDVNDMLSDAIRRAENGEEVRFVPRQWREVGMAQNILLDMNAHMIECAIGLEWASTLNVRLLRYLLENPHDGDRVRQTMETMVEIMSKFAGHTGGDGEEETHV